MKKELPQSQLWKSLIRIRKIETKYKVNGQLSITYQHESADFEWNLTFCFDKALLVLEVPPDQHNQFLQFDFQRNDGKREDPYEKRSNMHYHHTIQVSNVPLKQAR